MPPPTLNSVILNYNCNPSAMRRVVLKVKLYDDKGKLKALPIKKKKLKALMAKSGVPGVDSIIPNMKDKTLTVIGPIDPVDILIKLRNLHYMTKIISVGPAKESEKKDEPKKEVLNYAALRMNAIQSAQPKMLSSPSSSSSIGKHTLSQPFCFCKVEATLRYSNTPINPGRPFLCCPKYNNEDLPYCKFFRWADGTLDIEQEIQEIKNELLKKEEELKMDKIEFRKQADAIEKMLSNIIEVRKQDAENRQKHTLLNLYWAVAIVVLCYFLLSDFKLVS